MKKAILVLAVLCSLAFTATANAWHANGVTVTAVCNGLTGVYDVSATIQQSTQWPNATVKSVTPSTFPGTTTGTQAVTVVIKWSNGETQTFYKTVYLDGQCKRICEPVTVYVDRVVTNTVYVDRVVEVPVEKIVEKVVYVEKPVVKVVTKTKIKYVTKWKLKVVVKFKFKESPKCKPAPKPDCEGDCSEKKKREGASG